MVQPTPNNVLPICLHGSPKAFFNGFISKTVQHAVQSAQWEAMGTVLGQA